MAQAGEIRFDAIIDTSDYDSGVKDIQNATRKIEDSAEQADKAIGDVGKNAGSGAPKIKDHSRRRSMVSGNWRTVWV